MNGVCLCGQIRFEVLGTANGFAICHCGQCRRQSGHVWASAHVPDAKLKIEGEPRWYQSSDTARRGFCPTCGSFLFWKHADDPHISFSLGSLETPSGARLEKHIFTSDKGDYYEIEDDLPKT